MEIKYKELKFEEVFTFKRGKRLIEEDQILGDVAYISSTKENNGISGFINPPDFMVRYKNKLTLSNSGSVGYCFYHDYEFVASDHVTVIGLKGRELTKEIALYLKPVLESIRYKYNFGREISDKRIKKEIICLPFDEDTNSPNWEIMIDCIKKLKKEITFNKINTNLCFNEKLDIDNWQLFNLVDYFDMYAGSYYPANEYKNGNIPLISASNKDNGIMALTDLEPTFDGNCLTIGKVEMAVFYQNGPFCATSDVTVLVPKFKLNKYIGLFLKTILEQENYKWPYGRQIRLNDSQKLKVLLPQKDNKPDWEKMEKIIKKIEFSDKI